MGRYRTFLGVGAMFLVFSGWAIGFGWAAGWNPPFRIGAVLAGLGLAMLAVGLYVRWHGWD